VTRRPALDGLRALAVLGVVAFHYAGRHLPGGALEVQVFFVLSGWLITSLLAGELARHGTLDVRAFYVRRALRLWPPLLVVIAFVVVAALLAGPARNLGWAALGSLLCVNDVFVPLFMSNGWLDQTWFVSVEWQLYLAWPFVVGAGLRTLSPTRLGRAFALAAAAALVLEVAGALPGAQGLFYFTPLGNLAPFLAGSALALLRLRVPRALGVTAMGLLVLLCRFGPSPADAVAWLGPEQSVTLLAVVLVGWLAGDRDVPVLSAKPLVWLGQRSYALYLWHPAVMVFLVSVLDAPQGRVVALIGVPASVVLAALTHRYVERPVLAHRRPARRGAAEAPAAVLPVADAVAVKV
jgi:peptidoglycan/LPS O-acetylase OafA/YrhL